ncbi:MAG TPA: serine/threonine-protein kinase [Ktedonobacteraceae bacterium]|nr:serine/threonine-protein kinase [Ktedonobacteraceae bacterium]
MFLTGQQFGRYYFQHLIEQGGMGEIYLATDTRLHRNVAIKVIRSVISSHADAEAVNEALRLFQREAKAVTMLEHPHILPLYDYGEERLDGFLFTYFVMPYREEGSLANWVSRRGKAGKLSLYEAAHYLLQAADALQYAHDHGIIHRDVKPSNFLIVSNKQHTGRPDLQLTDFGVAKFMKAVSTPTGVIRGTPLYMAPEQWRGEAVPASDQYALAVMMYQFLTGRLPFQGENYALLRHEHAYEEPPPPSALNALIPGEVDIVLTKALAKEPEQRYTSIDGFARAFQQALARKKKDPAASTGSWSKARNSARHMVTLPDRDELVVPAYGPKQLPRLRMFDQQHPRNLLLLISVILLIVCGLGIVLYSTIFGHTNAPRQTVAAATIQTETASATPHKRAATTTSAAANATNTAIAVSATSAAATATAAAAATGTAIAQATAIAATTATATAYNGAIMSGHRVLFDPLQHNNAGENWDTVDISSGAGCAFTQGTYHAGELQSGNFSACFAHNTDFSNFSYQVNMDIVKGDLGGIAFRANADNGTFYYFYVDTHGNYALVVVNSFIVGSDISHGFSSAMRAGLNQTNLIAVVARGDSIEIYINRQLVTQATDSTYAHGQIAVVAQDVNNVTDVSFSDAQVWQ